MDCCAFGIVMMVLETVRLTGAVGAARFGEPGARVKEIDFEPLTEGCQVDAIAGLFVAEGESRHEQGDTVPGTDVFHLPDLSLQGLFGTMLSSPLEELLGVQRLAQTKRTA